MPKAKRRSRQSARPDAPYPTTSSNSSSSTTSSSESSDPETLRSSSPENERRDPLLPHPTEARVLTTPGYLHWVLMDKTVSESDLRGNAPSAVIFRSHLFLDTLEELEHSMPLWASSGSHAFQYIMLLDRQLQAEEERRSKASRHRSHPSSSLNVPNVKRGSPEHDWVSFVNDIKLLDSKGYLKVSNRSSGPSKKLAFAAQQSLNRLKRRLVSLFAANHLEDDDPIDSATSDGQNAHTSSSTVLSKQYRRSLASDQARALIQCTKLARQIDTESVAAATTLDAWPSPQISHLESFFLLSDCATLCLDTCSRISGSSLLDILADYYLEGNGSSHDRLSQIGPRLEDLILLGDKHSCEVALDRLARAKLPVRVLCLIDTQALEFPKSKSLTWRSSSVWPLPPIIAEFPLLESIEKLLMWQSLVEPSSICIGTVDAYWTFGISRSKREVNRDPSLRDLELSLDDLMRPRKVWGDLRDSGRLVMRTQGLRSIRLLPTPKKHWFIKKRDRENAIDLYHLIDMYQNLLRGSSENTSPTGRRLPALEKPGLERLSTLCLRKIAGAVKNRDADAFVLEMLPPHLRGIIEAAYKCCQCDETILPPQMHDVTPTDMTDIWPGALMSSYEPTLRQLFGDDFGPEKRFSAEGADLAVYALAPRFWPGMNEGNNKPIPLRFPLSTIGPDSNVNDQVVPLHPILRGMLDVGFLPPLREDVVLLQPLEPGELYRDIDPLCNASDAYDKHYGSKTTTNQAMATSEWRSHCKVDKIRSFEWPGYDASKANGKIHLVGGRTRSERHGEGNRPLEEWRFCLACLKKHFRTHQDDDHDELEKLAESAGNCQDAATGLLAKLCHCFICKKERQSVNERDSLRSRWLRPAIGAFLDRDHDDSRYAGVLSLFQRDRDDTWRSEFCPAFGDPFE